MAGTSDVHPLAYRPFGTAPVPSRPPLLVTSATVALEPTLFLGSPLHHSSSSLMLICLLCVHHLFPCLHHLVPCIL